MTEAGIDWRLPEHRRELFVRYALWEIYTRGQSGSVYSFLPAHAEERGLDEYQRLWLAWLSASTHNPVSDVPLLDASADGLHPEGAIQLWREKYADLRWDKDRRYVKKSFGPATEEFLASPASDPETWRRAGDGGWDEIWRLATSIPTMGRLSAWWLSEVVRILLPEFDLPDADTLLLDDKSGSRSHRNGLAYVAGYDSAPKWGPADADMLGLVPMLEDLGADLRDEIRARGGNDSLPLAGYLTLETALCAFKGFTTARRRYPNVYVDEFYYGIRAGEEVWGRRYETLWRARARDVADYALLERRPLDPGLHADKHDLYRLHGGIVNMGYVWDDMYNDLDRRIAAGEYGRRADA